MGCQIRERQHAETDGVGEERPGQNLAGEDQGRDQRPQPGDGKERVTDLARASTSALKPLLRRGDSDQVP
jgi:hypothetical protein